MKLIKPSAEIIEPTGYTIDDIYKSIELVGRVSHKSEDRITEDSAKTFVERMMKMKHLSTCEFGTVYLTYTYSPKDREGNKFINKYLLNHHTNIKTKIVESINVSKPLSEQKIGEKIKITKIKAYITTNYRVLVENNWLDDLKYLCEPTEYHHKRYTVKFICDRGILAEFTRHRKFSFMAESTRYCNYSLGKFNNELTFIIPEWLDIEEGHHKYDYSFVDQKWMGPNNTEVSYQWLDTNGYAWYPNTDEHLLLKSLSDSEEIYFKLLEQGWKPQQARAVLPSALKTELYMCGFVEDWKKFFELRCAANAHPQAKELAIPLHEEFKNKNYIV